MLDRTFNCPICGAEFALPRAPLPTVDMLIYDRYAAAIVLVRRRFAPLGWALPGGFVEYGETVEAAAQREALEETSLRARIKGLLGVYSDPARDARGHAISTVFWGEADNPEQIQGGDDAGEARFFALNALPAPIVFDHARIIDEFVALIARLG